MNGPKKTPFAYKAWEGDEWIIVRDDGHTLPGTHHQRNAQIIVAYLNDLHRNGYRLLDREGGEKEAEL